MLKHFLAIETSTDACTIAICYQNQIEFFYEIAPKQHSELLLPQIDLLLEKLNIRLIDLDAIIVGEGPGSFTGVRMGLSVAQGLCLATGLKAYQIPTLLAVALSGLPYPLSSQKSVIVAIDARMGEVYAQRFEVQNALLVPTGKIELGRFEKVLSRLVQPSDTALYGVGNGFAVYAEDLEPFVAQFERIDGACFPHAGHFSQHLLQHPTYARSVESLSELLPVYVRDKVASHL
ncbi:MAG: tRNA (adenosine(37)-N6)-threonylcarbamoyltransferase complex dimerization subunit type 1 TsaB [Gammaproteobacteria bacterium]